MHLRKFQSMRQRNEERVFQAVRTCGCSGRTALVVFLFAFLSAQLVSQHRGVLSTLQKGRTVGVNLISEKYNDIANSYHPTTDTVSGTPHEAKSDGATVQRTKHMPITDINPADEDLEPGPNAVAAVDKNSIVNVNGRKEIAKAVNVAAEGTTAINPGNVNTTAKSTAGITGEAIIGAGSPASKKGTGAEASPDVAAQKAENVVPTISTHKTVEITTKQQLESSNPEAPANAVQNKPVAEEEKPEKTLAEHLNFSEKTAINYMHFHKTGGVSFKTALFTFFLGQKKRNGEEVRLRDACYMRKVQATGSVPTFDRWRCDWAPVWEMTETERNKLDVVFGHQYWVNGAEAFLNQRDMRTFTVIRHPFDRKVSFFFHFFVRERKRDETKVEFDEVRDFLLYDKIRDKSLELGKDLGPNYMAGRLLSDGFEGYVGNAFHSYYDVKPEQKLEVAERALKIMRKYMFIGLQSESEAAKCMLRKTVDVFNAAHGIDNPMTADVARTAKVLNTGAYSLTAAKIWERLSLEERILFDRKERVDLTIYQEGERLFKQQVRLSKCDHLVKRKQLLYEKKI